MLIHQAFVYGSVGEFVGTAARCVRDGLERGDTIFAATKAANVDALREELGDDAAGVELIDTTHWRGRPYERLQDIRQRVASLPEGTRLRALGEPLWDGSAAVVRHWARFESLINLALEDAPLRFVCLYDSSALPAEILEHATHTHPESLHGPAAVPCLAFVPPDEFAPGEPADFPEPAIDLPLDGGEFRRAVAGRAREAGMPQQRVDDFVTAANEVLTNAFQHGAPPVRARLWTDDGDLVCRVSDAGGGVADPLTGWIPPAPTSSRGWGLPLVHRLSDAVEIVPGKPGTEVSIYAALPSGNS